jgi:hypothetical protein
MIKRVSRNRNRRQRRTRRRMRKMRGGAFSQDELQQLQNNGFSEYQIQSLTDLGVSFNQVMQKIDTIMNQDPQGFSGNSDDLAEHVMDELQNSQMSNNLQNISQATDEDHLNMDNSSQGTMNLDELNTSNSSGYTTEEDESFGGKRRKRTKKRRGKKRRKTRKQQGGMCFGNGVGANSNNPNYSIYNTKMMNLFPYKVN